MSFLYERVRQATTQSLAMQSTPIIKACLAGNVERKTYQAFLAQAYHHVLHTVPLLRACRARIPARLAWLQAALDEYVEEEQGHDEWILNDLRACGIDPGPIRQTDRKSFV